MQAPLQGDGVSAPLSVRAFDVVSQCGAISRVRAILDDSRRPFARCQTTQVGKPVFRDDNVDIVLGMIDMRDHRHDARNIAVLRDRFGDEY